MPLPFPALLTSGNGCRDLASHSVQGKHNRRVVFQKYFNLEGIVVETVLVFLALQPLHGFGHQMLLAHLNEALESLGTVKTKVAGTRYSPSEKHTD